jgi:hypothetical protein
MEVKAEYADYPAYFNEEDKQELLALSDELAMRVMLEVKECSARYYIGAGTCPFCIITRGFHAHLFQNMDCSDCSYGKRHGICDDEEGNDYEAFCGCLDEEDRDEGILNPHFALADEVITEFVNSRLTSTPQLE